MSNPSPAALHAPHVGPSSSMLPPFTSPTEMMVPFWKFPPEFRALLERPEVRGAMPAASLSDSDRRTLRSALLTLKSARADAKSSDKDVRRSGTIRLITLVSYLHGFFEGKDSSATVPGLASIAAPMSTADFDGLLDELENVLGELIVKTRIGLLLTEGIVFIVAGIALTVIADQMPDSW